MYVLSVSVVVHIIPRDVYGASVSGVVHIIPWDAPMESRTPAAVTYDAMQCNAMLRYYDAVLSVLIHRVTSIEYIVSPYSVDGPVSYPT